MKVALVHDHLNQLGGAERVLKTFTEMYPDAPMYTLIYDARRTNHLFDGTKIIESFIARFPLARRMAEQRSHRDARRRMGAK